MDDSNGIVDLLRLNDPLPRHTGSTDLTNDELIILDALFQLPSIDTRQLKRTNYPIHMNVGYTHSFSLQELRARLELWEQEGIVLSHPSPYDDGGTLWDLTPAGGALWEQERQPIWDRYVENPTYSYPIEEVWAENMSEEFRFPSADKPTTVVISPNLSIVNAYAATATGSRLHRLRSSRRQHFVWQGFTASYKQFAEVHILCLPIEPDAPDYVPTDWDRYERERIWWRTIPELDTLHAQE